MKDLDESTTTNICQEDLDYINNNYPGLTSQERIHNLITRLHKLEHANTSRPAELTIELLKSLKANPKLIAALEEPL
jgi:hypothetical protein